MNASWPVRNLRVPGSSPEVRPPMYPYVAPDTTKIHTPITLGIRHRAKLHVFKLRTRGPCGFDSHRPLHFSLSGVSLRCPRTRLSLSPCSHSLDAATTGLQRVNVRQLLDRFRQSARGSSSIVVASCVCHRPRGNRERTSAFRTRARRSGGAPPINGRAPCSKASRLGCG
jgi:hypothetical protein